MLVLESAAALLALAYVLLAIKEDRKCWYAAILSSTLYIAVFYDARLYLEAGLQIFFIVLAFLGLKKWQSRIAKQESKIHYISLKKHLTLIALTTSISICFGFIIAQNTNADLPYLDALITCFSVMTTYLVAEKIIENWLYWIVIDVLSIFVNFHKGLYLFAILFFIYTIVAVIGYFNWKKEMNPFNIKNQSVG